MFKEGKKNKRDFVCPLSKAFQSFLNPNGKVVSTKEGPLHCENNNLASKQWDIQEASVISEKNFGNNTESKLTPNKQRKLNERNSKSVESQNNLNEVELMPKKKDMNKSQEN